MNRYIEIALKLDVKALIEHGLERPREIEIAVLQRANETIISRPGEVIPLHEFYDYEAKYVDPDGAKLVYPASLPPDLENSIRVYARQIFHSIGCQGLARIDFFITQDDQILFNEINTMPGFTKISMYPKLMEEMGISYSQLINFLIENGILLK